MAERDNSGKFVNGNTSGKGRPKKIRHTESIDNLRRRIYEILQANEERFQDELSTLSEIDFIDAYMKLLKLYLPSVRPVDIVAIERAENSSVGNVVMIPVETMTSEQYQKMFDEVVKSYPNKKSG